MKDNLRKGIIAGNFDVIHPGYVKMFQDDKENACDYLIIALHGDPTIERPHKCKPVQSIKEREYILMSIKYVDEIVHYDTEKDLLEIIKKHNHDVRIIGSDYKGVEFTGKSFEKEIYYHERIHDYSLTDLKKRIMEQMLAQNT